ncbi:MAG TPA: GDSL-type esterase/lipase family protein [Candidatus Saccharimonadales bacterium]|nr:GDSL-type esterase/lipase family protein [Candidatus Saccharimonadales bacterium]
MHAIIFVGDSILTRESQDNVAGLAPRLRLRFRDIEVRIIAAAGSNSSQTLASLAGRVLPDDSLVIVSVGMNDAAPWKSVPIKEFKENYTRILDILGGRLVILVTPYPVHTGKQRQPGRNNEVIERYAQVIQELARTHNVAYIDMYSIVYSTMHTADLHVSDGVHLNDTGYGLLTEAVSPLVEKWLNHKALRSFQ